MNSRTSRNERTAPRDGRRTRALPLFARVTAIAFVASSLLAMPANAQAAPVIDSAFPVTGTAGTQVQVNGSGLSRVETVYFGVEGDDEPAEVGFAAHSDSVLYFQVPEVAAGQYMIRVVSPDGDGSACCFTVTETDEDAGQGDADDEPDAVAPDASQSSCTMPDQNVQCNDFGRIAMESQRDIRGERIKMTATVRIDYDYQAQGARWVMFSIRNVTADGTNPVTVQVDSFSTRHGDVITTKIEDGKPHETNMWVDIIDVPVGEPITLDLTVGATDRGAFRLETLVMIFDRGYAPLKDAKGNDISLFAFTLLGVNKETSAQPAGGVSRVGNLPAPGYALAGTAILALVAFGSRRWSS